VLSLVRIQAEELEPEIAVMSGSKRTCSALGSRSRYRRSSLGNDRVCLDLHEPARIEQGADYDRGRDRPDVGEDLAVRCRRRSNRRGRKHGRTHTKVQHFYSGTLSDLLDDVRTDLERVPPDVEPALAHIRKLSPGERSAA
jgi:hypothetical protein